jgi:hypothetical protein
MSSAGFFKCSRNPEGIDLAIAYPNAFILLYIIAYRAQRTAAFNRYGLKPGEALIGDYVNCGMSQQNYRTAKQQLQKFNFATFKPTSRGTIAKLINTRVFDINAAEGNEHSNSQPTSSPRTANDYQECKEGEEGKKAAKKEAVFSFKKACAEEMLKGGE